MLCIVGCRGVEQLGRLVQGSPGLVPLREKAGKYFLFTESSLVLKMKNT